MTPFEHWLDALPLPKAQVRPMPFDWSAVDWSLDNQTIAEHTGYSYSTVASKRTRPSAQRARSRCKWASYDWASLDWSQSNNELSRRTGIEPNTVRNYRIKLGLPRATTPGNGQKFTVTPAMIEAADWIYQRDVDIAQQWGVTRERVRQLRQQYRKPQCRAKNLSAKLLACLRWIDLNRTSIEGKHVADVLPRMPEASRPVRLRALHKAGVKLHYLFSSPQCHPHVRLVNWALPNIVIGMIWTTFSAENAVANARTRWHFGPPKWPVQRFDHITDDMIDAARAEIARVKALNIGVVPNEAAFDKWLAYRADLAAGPQRQSADAALHGAPRTDPPAP